MLKYTLAAFEVIDPATFAIRLTLVNLVRPLSDWLI